MFRAALPETRQPAGPVPINWGHPSTKGLVFLASLGAGEGFYDLVSKKPGTRIGLTSRKLIKNGSSLPVFGTSNYLDLPNISGLTGSMPLTIAWTQQADGTSSYSNILAWKPEGASNSFAIFLAASDPSYYFTAGPRGGSVASFATGALTDGVLDNYVLLILSGTDTIPTGPGDGFYRLFRNGVEVSRTSNSSTSSFSSAVFRLGALEDGSNPFEGAIGNLHIWRRALTASEAIAWSKNPYITRLVYGAPRWIPASSGTNTYTINPSGAVAFSGASALLRTRAYVPSGSVVFSGTSPQLRIRALIPTGLITFSGTAPITFNAPNIYTIVPTGSITFSGTAPNIRERITVPTGEITFSGTAPQIRTRITTPSGQVFFSGTAPMIFLPAGGLASADVNRISIGVSRAVGMS